MEAEQTAVPADPQFFPKGLWNIVQLGFGCVFTLNLYNFWVYPSLVYNHTGVFLVAYYLLLILVCCPLVFIQIKLGSVYKRGILILFANFIPALKGVGVAVMVIAFIHVASETTLISQGTYYACASLSYPFGWSKTLNFSDRPHASQFHMFVSSKAQDYYFNSFLETTSSTMLHSGKVPWHRGLSLFFTWVLIYLMIFRGPNWTRKVLYFSGPLALLLLFGLLVYTHTAVPNSFDSLKYMYLPSSEVQHSQLMYPETWLHALDQQLRGLCLWLGVIPMLSTHTSNKKTINFLSWLMLLVVHSLLPQLVTIMIAPLVHAHALYQKTTYTGIKDSGPYLMFVLVAEALAEIGVCRFWAFALYFCMVCFAVHEMALLLTMIMENLVEWQGELIQKLFRRREIFCAVLCFSAFLLGLPLVTQGGLHLTSLVYEYLFRTLYILVLLYIPPLILAYVNIDRLYFPVEKKFICIWVAFAGLITVVLLIYKEYAYGSTLYRLSWRSTTPTWGTALGWKLALAPILCPTLAGALHAYVQAKNTGFIERTKEIFRPVEEGLLADQSTQVATNHTTEEQAEHAKLKTNPHHQNGAVVHETTETKRKSVEVAIKPEPNEEVAHV